MRLEEVTAELRPRSSWESVDLGFAMVRRHFRLLLLAWSITVLPLWALLLGSSYWIPLELVVWILWWLKPLYDRVPLFILSRALFGSPPALREVLRAWPGMLFKNSLPLLIRRVPWLVVAPQFAYARSLLLPAVDLEGQKGGKYRERQAVLLRQAAGTGPWLTILCAAYEMLLVLGLFILAASWAGLTAGSSETTFRYIEMLNHGAAPPAILWSAIGCYLLSITLVEIFYVGGGFGLYLNCRTQLEGWDVEIAFRRLAQRLSKATTGTVLLFGLFLGFGLAPAAHAQLEKPAEQAAKIEAAAEPKSDEQRAIEHIKADKDFHVYTETWRKRKASEDSGSNYSNVDLSALGTVVFYLAIFALAAGLCWLIYINRHLFARGPSVAIPDPAAPRTVMGMDVSPESLPADVAGAARELWARGDARAALSLLYRGSLAWLVHVAQLRIRESDTEGDCVRRTQELPEPLRREYFSSLTQEWVGAAYAERVPEDLQMERLLESWPFAGAGGRSR